MIDEILHSLLSFTFLFLRFLNFLHHQRWLRTSGVIKVLRFPIRDEQLIPSLSLFLCICLENTDLSV